MSVCVHKCVCVSCPPHLPCHPDYKLGSSSVCPHTHIHPQACILSSGPQVSFLESPPFLWSQTTLWASCPICHHHIRAESASRNKVSHVTGLLRTPQDPVPAQYSVALHPKSRKICLQIYPQPHHLIIHPTNLFKTNIYWASAKARDPAPGRACWSWDRSLWSHGPRAPVSSRDSPRLALFPLLSFLPIKSILIFQARGLLSVTLTLIPLKFPPEVRVPGF